MREPRVAVVATVSGPFRLDWEELPPPVQEIMARRTGGVDAAHELAQRSGPRNSRPDCPPGWHTPRPPRTAGRRTERGPSPRSRTGAAAGPVARQRAVGTRCAGPTRLPPPVRRPIRHPEHGHEHQPGARPFPRRGSTRAARLLAGACGRATAEGPRVALRPAGRSHAVVWLVAAVAHRQRAPGTKAPHRRLRRGSRAKPMAGVRPDPRLAA